MKKSILGITKSAMKYFFDIDPMLTEQVVLHTAVQLQVIHHEMQHTLQHNLRQHKTRMVRLLRMDTAGRWNPA